MSRESPASTQILPDQEETNERDNGASEEDIHVLGASWGRRVGVISMKSNRTGCGNIPSLLDPPNNIPTKTQCVRGVKQPPLRALQHIPLVHQVVQYCSALCDEFVKPCVCILDKAVFAERMLLSRYAVQMHWGRSTERRLRNFFCSWCLSCHIPPSRVSGASRERYS